MLLEFALHRFGEELLLTFGLERAHVFLHLLQQPVGLFGNGVDFLEVFDQLGESAGIDLAREDENRHQLGHCDGVPVDDLLRDARINTPLLGM